MENLVSTIQKEVNSNSLYLNHCNKGIQLLRSLNGFCCEGDDLSPALKLMPLNSLKSILNELLTKKEEQAQRTSKEFEILTEQEEQRSELNPNFEKANNQIIESYESKNENEVKTTSQLLAYTILTLGKINAVKETRRPLFNPNATDIKW